MSAILTLADAAPSLPFVMVGEACPGDDRACCAHHDDASALTSLLGMRTARRDAGFVNGVPLLATAAVARTGSLSSPGYLSVKLPIKFSPAAKDEIATRELCGKKGWTAAATCRIARPAITIWAETLPLSAVEPEIRMVITYNEPVTFGRYGTARNLNCTGIDFLEDGNQSWTSAPVAELDIQLPFARQDVVLELDATPFILPDIVSAQKVFIFVGGMFVGYCSFTEHDIRTFPVSRNVISGRTARLSLVIPTARSPNSLRMSEDMRELGICLNSIAFKTMT